MEFASSGSNPDGPEGEEPIAIASNASISTNCNPGKVRKPPRRSSSPINWYPRKKTESFLKRKLQLLQESEGTCPSLDETLGSANPHYTRMAREKIAAYEAAKKVIKARKVAMIEASWCRILHAARIPRKDAEERREKAEREVEKAFEEASSMGVMMYDRSDRPRRSCEIEKSSIIGGVSSHTIAASFETAFEVDKDVAMAIKNAFMRMARCPSSSNKDEFKDLLHKISENPEEVAVDGDVDSGSPHLQSNQNLINPNYDVSDSPQTTKLVQNVNFESTDVESKQDLVNVMFDRLSLLSEDEISSLAVIVATTGLNAALERSNGPSGPITAHFSQRSHQAKKRESGADFPSLDKFLVRHVSKLEKEVQEAKIISKKLESNAAKTMGNHSACPDLGSILVRHVSKLEREIHSLKDSFKRQKTSGLDADEREDVDIKGMEREKENLEPVNEEVRKSQRFEETKSTGLDQILIKHKSKLEMAKLEASSHDWSMPSPDSKKKGKNQEVGPSLEQILVKYKPNLEKSKSASTQSWTEERVKPASSWRAARDQKVQEEWGGLSLANSLKPSLSRLEREKAAWKKAEEEETRRARAL